MNADETAPKSGPDLAGPHPSARPASGPMGLTLARELVYKIAATWPGEWFPEASRDQWSRDMQMLDHAVMVEVLVRLRRTADKRPSLAAFRREAAALRGVHATHVVECDVCDGTGWAPTTETALDGRTNTAVRPCGCQNGTDRKALYARIRKTNDER